jgi:hypothetical protein
VIIDLVGGGSELYDNSGTGFPVQDSIMLQSPQSCAGHGKLTVVAAVSTLFGFNELNFYPDILYPTVLSNLFWNRCILGCGASC